MLPPSGSLEELQAHTAQSVYWGSSSRGERKDFEMRSAPVIRIYNLIFINKWLVTCQCWSVTKAYTASSTWAVHIFVTLSILQCCIFGKITHWRRPGTGRRVRRRSRRSPPRTGVRTRCCRSSVLTAGWKSWDGAWSCRRHCFDPGNHGRLSEALCYCCC